MATTLHHLRGDVASADVTLLCQGRRFPAHRLVLSAGSLYFRSIFHGRMKREQHGNKVNVPAPVTAEVLEDLLEFLYTGNIRYRNYDVDFLIAAVASCKFLQIDDHFAYNLHLLAEYWSANDVQELYNLVMEYESTNWPSQVVSHLVNKFCHIHKRHDFLNLGQNELNKLLQYLKPEAVPASEFAASLLSWVNFDKTRSIDIVTLTFMSTFTRLSPELSRTVLNNNDSSSKESRLLKSNRLNSKLTKNPLSTQKLICFRYEGKQGIMRFYDIEMDTWSQAEILPFSLLRGSTIVEFEQHIYLFGGSPSRRTGGSAEAIIYCPASNTSIYKGSLCFPVIAASAGVLRGLIYVVGGKNWLNHIFPTHRVQCYDPTTGECKEIDRTYNANWRCTVVTSEDCLYVVDLDGGTTSMERYDPKSDQWSIIEYTLLSERILSSTFINGKLFLTIESIEDVFHTFQVSKDVKTMTVDHGSSVIIDQMWSTSKEGRPVILVQSDTSNLHVYDIKSNDWKNTSSSARFLEDSCGSVAMTCRQDLQIPTKPVNQLTTTADYMRRHSICTDVILLCNGTHEFHAHQLVLSVASPFFRLMFCSGFKESVTGVVNLPTMSYDIMKNILEFIYTGKMQDDAMDMQLMLEILAASHLMNIPSVFRFCLFKLVEDLSHDNYLTMLDLANYLYDQAFASHIITFLAHNFESIVQHETYQELDDTFLRRFLHHPDLQYVCSIDSIVQAVLLWVDTDVSRVKYLKDLLSIINMKYLSTECFNLISSHDTIKSNPDIFGTMINEMEQVKTTTELFGQQLLNVGWNTVTEKHEVMLYDIYSNRWSKDVTEYPCPMAEDITLIGFGSHVYFFGGFVPKSDTVTENVSRYCPFSKEVTVVGRLKFGIAGAGAGVVDDAIYVVGGTNAEGQSCRSVQRFIPALNVCDEVAHTTEPYFKPDVLTHESLLYVIGTTRSDTNVVECYNSLLDQWTVITTIPMLYEQCSSAICDGKLYFLARNSNDDDKADPKMHVYNFDAKVWEAYLEMNSRTFSRACRLLSTQKGRKSVIFVFQYDKFHKLLDITNSKWDTRVVSNGRHWEKDMTALIKLPKNRNN